MEAPNDNKPEVDIPGDARDDAKKESLETDFAFRAFTGLPADLTITCGERKWMVHKHIMSARSKFFAIACDGRFKEGTQNLVDLPGDDPVAVDAMIQFIYLGQYCQIGALECLEERYMEHEEWLSLIEWDSRQNILRRLVTDRNGKPEDDDDDDDDDDFLNEELSDNRVMHRSVYNMTVDLPFHAHMYAMGEKYQMPSLKSAACSYFEELFLEDYECVYTDWFRHAARIAYTSTIETDRGMRDLVSKAISQRKDSMEGEFMKKLLGELKDLATDVLLALF